MVKKKTTKEIRAIDRIIKFQIDDGIESLTIAGKEALADLEIDNKNNVTLYLNADKDKINELTSLVPFINLAVKEEGVDPDRTKSVTLSQDLTQFALEIADNSKELANLIKTESSIILDLDGIAQKLLEIAGKLAELEAKDLEQDNRLTDIEEKDLEQDNRLTEIETKDLEQDNRFTLIETKDLEQDNRLTDIEEKDLEQDNRLTVIETKDDETDVQLAKTTTMEYKPSSVWGEFQEHSVNVKWFGAKGDNITDDTLSIQKAIDTGLNVYFPVGVYLVKSVRIRKSGQIIKGGGKVRSWGGNPDLNETIVKGIGTGTEFIFVNSLEQEDGLVSATRFEDLIIDGNGKTTNGIRLGNSSVVRGVRVRDCIVGIKDVLVSIIDNCEIFDNTDGIKTAVDSRITNSFFVGNTVALNLTDSNDNIISNNKIEWNGKGIFLKAAVFNMITGNIFDRQTTYGVETESVGYTTIVGNQFERNLQNHMYLLGGQFLITGNTFFRKNSEDGGQGQMLPNEAIFLKSVSQSNISGNISCGKMYNSVGIDSVTNVSWEDNIVDGFNPQKLYTGLPTTVVGAGERKVIQVEYPTTFREDIKNPWNVRLVSQKIRLTTQNGNFYAQGGIIESIFFNQTTIDVTINNKTAGSMTFEGELILECTLRTIV